MVVSSPVGTQGSPRPTSHHNCCPYRNIPYRSLVVRGFICNHCSVYTTRSLPLFSSQSTFMKRESHIVWLMISVATKDRSLLCEFFAVVLAPEVCYTGTNFSSVYPFTRLKYRFATYIGESVNEEFAAAAVSDECY